jgi:phytoene desaturase
MKQERHVLIIGGGLAGLAAGCYLQASGYRTTIVEHGLALGGVCTAWTRGGYTIDGCIHWLTGGAFAPLYGELGITPKVELRPLQEFVSYRDEQAGIQLSITADLDATARAFGEIAREDRAEIARVVEGARQFAKLRPAIDPPPELSGLRDNFERLWSLRHGLPHLVHFRKPLGVWAREHLKSPALRKLLSRIVPEEAPALFLLMVLGYLEQGELSRPLGGTAAFRDALIETYLSRGGKTLLHSTVDEVLVEGDRARGVRLADGEILYADHPRLGLQRREGRARGTRSKAARCLSPRHPMES